jgi:hypothetical protein
MRFMIIRKADQETEFGDDMPTPELAQAMIDYHEEMGRDLKVLDGNGLHPSRRDAARVRFNKGKPLVTDGPFAETKELIAGYTMVEAPSLAAVVEWAKKWPALDAGGHVELEIRRVYEVEELGVFEGELREAHDRVLNKG